MLRVTVSIDESDMGALLKATGVKKKARAIRSAISTFLQSSRRDALLALRGRLDIDPVAWRALREADRAKISSRRH